MWLTGRVAAVREPPTTYDHQTVLCPVQQVEEPTRSEDTSDYDKLRHNGINIDKVCLICTDAKLLLMSINRPLHG